MSVCGSCNPCGGGCQKQCCNTQCFRWGFDGCFLRGRCADGTELDPLDLCAWLKQHETCTDFRLVVDSTVGGYMQFTNECGYETKVFVCDFLSLGNLECIGNVYDREQAQPCDLLVFSPDCNNEGDPHHNKWSPYHIPDAGNCVMQPDANGYFKVLKKNACGCIEECNLFAQSTTWEYSLRDSWPDDPDWPFTEGSYDEVIDLKLDTKIPMWNKADLEVTFQYGYGIQCIGARPSWTMDARHYENFQSVVTPVTSGTGTSAPVAYNTIPVSASDMITKAITNQGNNLLPWGSWEWQTSRTVIVPKGQKLYLHHRVAEKSASGDIVPKGSTTGTPGADCSRLHQLHVFVRATKGSQL